MLIKGANEPSGRTHLFRLGPTPPGAPVPLVRTYENGFVETIEYQSAAEVQEIIDSVSQAREINNWRQHRTPEEDEPKGIMSARIPMTFYANWRRLWREQYRGEMLWMEFLIKMLNSREYRQFNAMPSGEIPLYEHQAR